MLTGDHRSSTIGIGTELAQIRLYQPGDDVRRIDWAVTARTGDIHVRDQIAERALVSWLVLDTSPSMTFGTADRRKADVAEGVALAVGHVGTRRQPAGADHLRRRQAGHHPVAAGPRRAAGDAGHRAPRAAARGRRGHLAGRGPGPDRAAGQQPLLIFVVSDFRGPRDWRRELIELAGRHDVVAVEIRDQREQGLPDVGELWLVDPGTAASSGSTPAGGGCASGSRPPPQRAGRAGRPAPVLRRRPRGVWTAGDWLRSFAGFLRHRVTGPAAPAARPRSSGDRRRPTPAAPPTSAPPHPRARGARDHRRPQPWSPFPTGAPRPGPLVPPAGAHPAREATEVKRGAVRERGVAGTPLDAPARPGRARRLPARPAPSLPLHRPLHQPRPAGQRRQRRWRRTSPAFYLLALAALLVSLARPQALALVPRSRRRSSWSWTCPGR